MIEKIIAKSIEVKQNMLADKALLATVEKVVSVIVEAYKNGGTVWFCGNGGSAADAQHLAAELSGRFYYDRPPLASEALHVNTSYLTAVANDYSFGEVYARYIRSCGKKGDVLIGLSTSGNSENIVNAINAARENGLTTVAFTGSSGGKLKLSAEFLINIPSDDTPRIQESHILIGHILCELVEKAIFPV